MRSWLDKTQWKHVAALVDRLSLTFCGWAGYNAWVSGDAIILCVVAMIFVLAQYLILGLIKEDVK